MGKLIIRLFGVLVVCVVIGIIVGSRLQVVSYKVTTTKTKDSFRIVQISDFHSNKYQGQVDKLIEQTTKANPDYIVLSGDILDASDMDSTVSFIEQLTPIAPIVYARGNHDTTYGTYKQFKQQLLDMEVYVLDNKAIVLDDINFIGIADLSQAGLSADSSYASYISEQQMLINENKYNVVIGHRPNYLSAYANIGSDLVLSGHAHGGQWQIPFTNTGIIAPDEGLFPRHVEGEFNLEDTTQIVSTGTSNPYEPFVPRLYNPRQLVVIDIN